jgi:pyruvate-ferredoxin/flavodoxin oxidoreductase
LASGANVNILVLDTEVYSNTGGQASKATPMGAVARFATAGKRKRKKDLGLMAMTYGNVFVAQVSMGADKQQFINAVTQAEAYDGPSIILAYSPCIAHGAPMSKSMEECKNAVACGYWPLYRFDPTKKQKGENPFTLDSKAPTADFKSFLLSQNRFATLFKSNPELAEELFAQAEQVCKQRLAFYQALSTLETSF